MREIPGASDWARKVNTTFQQHPAIVPASPVAFCLHLIRDWKGDDTAGYMAAIDLINAIEEVLS